MHFRKLACRVSVTLGPIAAIVWSDSVARFPSSLVTLVPEAMPVPEIGCPAATSVASVRVRVVEAVAAVPVTVKDVAMLAIVWEGACVGGVGGVVLVLALLALAQSQEGIWGGGSAPALLAAVPHPPDLPHTRSARLRPSQCSSPPPPRCT